MNWRQLLRRLAAPANPDEEAGVNHTVPTFAEQVLQAKLEWKRARMYFESVSDPDLVDHAIAVMHATEKKYMYLVRLARDQGISLPASEVSATG
jgi:hypothetical protein